MKELPGRHPSPVQGNEASREVTRFSGLGESGFSGAMEAGQVTGHLVGGEGGNPVQKLGL